MENNSDLSLYHIRSYRAAVRDGYQLYVSNFRRIFKGSWTLALIYALSVSLLLTLIVEQYPRILLLSMTQDLFQDSEMQDFVVSMTKMTAAILMVSLTTIALSSHAFTVFTEHQQSDKVTIPSKWYGHVDKRVLWRTVKADFFLFLIFLATGIVLSGVAWIGTRYLSPMASIGLLAVIAIALLTFYVPVVYVQYKYILNAQTSYFPVFSKSLSTGFRHWGALFAVLLVVCLVLGLASILTNLPANILYMAHIQSQMGVLIGDPEGMPEFMGWLTPMVFTVAGFIQAYIVLSMYYPLYYMYGSIEQEEKERKQI